VAKTRVSGAFSVLVPNLSYCDSVGETCPYYLVSDAGLRPETRIVRCSTCFRAHCLYPCTCAGNGCVTEVHVQLDMCPAQPCHV
jgi:hypothetical protein